MGKAPSFQYYPKDWQQDAVFGCSLAARGLWHEMINVMHGCEPYGYLAENDKPMPVERIARKCGTTPQEFNELLRELDEAGVPRRTASGIIFCKRMVEDERRRREWRNRQQKHRGVEEGTSERDVTPYVTHDVTPMSRVSPSPSPPTNLKPKATSGAETAPVPPNYVEIVKNLAKTKTITPQQASFGKVKSIASHVLWLLGHGWKDNADLKDEVKRWCSQNGIDYSPDEIRRALDVGSGKAKSA